jgi:DNA-binding winged helix-turn-helix (wHTH) protein/tetratricopeptide (TPR) repeat protein
VETAHRQQPESPRHLRVGDLDVDLIARTVQRHGTPLPVKGLSFELLACLIRRHPELASTREISQSVWGENLVTGATLTQRVKLLRDALAGSAEISDYIETVKSRGYRLAVPVEQVEAPEKRGAGSPRRIVAWAVLGALIAVAGWWLLRGQTAVDPSARQGPVTLFVLPLDDPGGDVEWSEGLRQEIIDRLGRIDDLSVTAVRELPSRVDEGAWALESRWVERDDGAEWVATLRDTATGEVLTQQRIGGAGPGQAPQRVPQSIVQEVSEALPGPNRVGLEESEEPPDPQAYELYLRARYHGAQYARSDLHRGAQLLDRALERDPDFARAYELRSMIYSLAGTPSYGWMTPDEAFALARRDALQALALDPGLAHPNVTLGNILLWHDWNPPAAEMAYRQALDIEPDSLSAWLSIALLHTVMGRYEESLAAIDHAIALAPLQAGVHSNAGWRRLGARHFEAALGAALEAEALDPTYRDAYNIQAWSLMFLGRLDEALQVPDEYLFDVTRGYLLAVSGQPGEARKHVQAMIAAQSRTYVPPAAIATVYIGLRDYDQALEWLERVVEQRSREALFFRSSAIYDPLREHPGFLVLMDRVGIWDDFSPPTTP